MPQRHESCLNRNNSVAANDDPPIDAPLRRVETGESTCNHLSWHYLLSALSRTCAWNSGSGTRFGPSLPLPLLPFFPPEEEADDERFSGLTCSSNVLILASLFAFFLALLRLPAPASWKPCLLNQVHSRLPETAGPPSCTPARRPGALSGKREVPTRTSCAFLGTQCTACKLRNLRSARMMEATPGVSRRRVSNSSG